MRLKRITTLIIALAAPLILSAQSACADEFKKIGLDDAIQLSVSNNLDLQSARIDVELAKNDIKSANRLQNPGVNVFYNYGKAGRSEPQQIGVTQMIEIGKRAPRKQLAKSNLYRKELEVKLAEFTLEMDVRETYVDLVGAKTILKNLEEQQEFLQELSELAKKRQKQGLSSGTEVLQAQIALNQICARINTAQTAVTSARNDFNKTLNLHESNRVVYDTKEDNLPDETVFISLKTPDYNVKMPAFELIAKKALEKRLDIRAAKQDLDSAVKNLTVVQRQRIPDVELFGGYSYLAHNNSDSRRYEPRAFAGAGISNIPVFYSYKPEIKNAKLQIEQAVINYESAKNKAMKDLNTSYERFVTSQKNLLFYKNRLIKDSEELTKLSKKEYAQGKTDLTSVIVMEQSYSEIVIGYVSALTDYYTDWIDFLREVNNEEFELFDEKL